MKAFFQRIARLAKQHPQRILFPEPFDSRILHAVAYLAEHHLAQPIVFSSPPHSSPSRLRASWPASSSSFKRVACIDITNPAKVDLGLYASLYVELRKARGKRVPFKRALQLMSDPMHLAVMMVAAGDADGVVGGATWPTAVTFRPALQIFRKQGAAWGDRVSSFFIMKHRGEFYFFADCALNITPDEHDLACIALSTAASAKRLLDVQPRVAMLSFSTHGSTDHELARKVRRATMLVKKKNPRLIVDGELQADAAVKPAIGRLKSKECSLKKPANVLIFPDLQSANIAYKLVEWLGHYEAVGPISQNLERPINDLSRGCTAEDVVKVALITSLQAQEAQAQEASRRSSSAVRHGGGQGSRARQGRRMP
ncbi:phosphotransacetylase [Candidatus Woesearchaeota archaeon]|nr:phosphotransacetylase [Candidatus Woesearchaeota archaeon]